MALNVDLSFLHAAVRKMGAERREFDIGHIEVPIDPIDIELEQGIELPGLKGVETENGLLSYQGRQILVYIQDQGSNIQEVLLDGAVGRKFHVADCRTLKSMRERGRYDRYVVTNRLDGSFYVTGQDWTAGRRIEGEANLRVCQNCLKALNYKGAQQIGAYHIVKDFDIGEFFETYSSFFFHMPRRKAGDAADETYSSDWIQVAAHFKAGKNFKCESCGVDLRDNKKLLHVHHLNGVKSDNDGANLKALCVSCHREQPSHGHLFVRHEDTQLINRLRRQQHLTPQGLDEWDEAFKLCDPGLEGLLKACQKEGSPVPEVGVDVKNSSEAVVANLELAWPRARVGVAIADEDRIGAQEQGWEVWSMIDALNGIRRFISATQAP